MRHFKKLASGVDTAPLVLELGCHPQLWNQYTARKVAPGTPHSQMDDVWVRWRNPVELTSPEAYGEPHIPVYYPAWTLLPSLRPIVRGVAAKVGADMIGGILITRIPPGGQIEPHADSGWHPEFFNCKVYVPLISNDYVFNTCCDDVVVMKTGDVFTFDNTLMHSVHNCGPTERITLIISMRCD